MSKPFCLTGFIFAVILISSPFRPAFSHCEIPCGIYDDQARIELISEHIDTIQKSMAMIIEFSDDENINYNQLVRWIDNKETHASKIQDIVFQYFMTQRIKSGGNEDKYIEELSLLHELAVAAMKSKQTTDLSYTKRMRVLLDDFVSVYFDQNSVDGKK